MMDAQDMTAVTGANYYFSGLHTPGTVMLQPAGFVRGIAEGLRGRIELFEGSPVTELKRDGSDWQVKTTQGKVTTGTVIFANNGHLESFGFQRRRLMHVFLYATMTGELSDAEQAALGGEPRWGITPSDPMGTTMRRIDQGQGGHRIVTRTCASFLPDMQAKDRHIARATGVMRRKFDRRFPA